MPDRGTLTVAEYAFQHRYLKGIGLFSYQADRAYYINIISDQQSQEVYYKLSEQTNLLPIGHNVIHYLDAKSTIEIQSDDADNNLVVVLIAPENLHFFHRTYQQNPERFANGYTTKSDARFRILLAQFQGLPNSGLLYKMRSDLILLEIIYHQIESSGIKNEDAQQTRVMKDHYEKILLAKQIIEEDFSKNYSIVQLAKAVGTNVQYLKKYFKQYFGKTVMNYITEKKMEHAKELILTGNHRVSDVARMTGYKHSTHFTTAFKKHFGFIPNSLKYSFLLQQGAEVLMELRYIF